MIKDEVFKTEIEKASDFKFSACVAKVFDDMVNRSGRGRLLTKKIWARL